MRQHENFKGCKAIIRDDETLEVLFDSPVLEHNMDREIITVLDEKRLLRRIDRVSLIILGKGKAYEFMGTTRKLFSDARIDIALYNCKITPIRAEPRYLINDEAVVESFVEKKSDMLRKLPLKVYIINLSATGALIEPVHVRFEVGEIIKLRFSLGGTQVTATTQILRAENSERAGERYGCRFLKVE